MPSDRIINEVFRKLEQAFARQKKLREESVLLCGIGYFLAEMNGPARAIGDVLVLGHADAIVPANKRLRLDWAKTFLEAGKLFDAKNAETMDLEGVDSEDLKAIVTKMAIELLSGDEEFRHACLVEALRRNPQLLEELNEG